MNSPNRQRLDFAASINTLLFDLDGTLTDYSASSLEGLKRAYAAASQLRDMLSFHRFASEYEVVIAAEHVVASKAGMKLPAFETRKKRFSQLFDNMKLCVNESVLRDMATQYGIGRAEGASLHPGVLETLGHLRQFFKIGLITEGSVETQMHQLDLLKLTQYFDSITISGATGFHKPSLELYQLALDSIHSLPASTVMIGDRLDWDIIPAHTLGMRTVFFLEDKTGINMINYNRFVDAEISRISDLIALLLD